MNIVFEITTAFVLVGFSTFLMFRTSNVLGDAKVEDSIIKKVLVNDCILSCIIVLLSLYIIYID